MVRTSSAGIKISSGKSSKKGGGGGSSVGNSSKSALTTSSRSSSGSTKLPSITHQETPSWQKPITNFFRSDASSSNHDTANCSKDDERIENKTHIEEKLESKPSKSKNNSTGEDADKVIEENEVDEKEETVEQDKKIQEDETSKKDEPIKEEIIKENEIIKEDTTIKEEKIIKEEKKIKKDKKLKEDEVIKNVETSVEQAHNSRSENEKENDLSIGNSQTKDIEYGDKLSSHERKNADNYEPENKKRKIEERETVAEQSS